jgi:AbrB family looped-hinge helix DNA binding protein
VLGGCEITTRLSSRGRITLPKTVREAHDWRPGLEFEIEDRPEGVLLKPVSPFPRTTIDDVLGCRGYCGPRRSIEEIDAGVLEEAKRHV